MAYVKDEDILDATNGGLDIILFYYPEANKVLGKAARRFKIRESEKTASASIKQLENGIWVVTDFGGDSKPRNGIHICMIEENIDYAEACTLLGARYNIKGADIVPVKPIIEKRPLDANESKGDYHFEAKDFTKEELAILGPRVNAVHCKEYSLVSLKSFTYCKENEAIITIATSEYPIFMFDYGTWQKIYQPNSADKGYRFRYAGKKPERFMFGLNVLEKEFKRLKKKQEDDGYEEEEDDDKKKKKKKDPRIDAVFLCSGGSDGLNLRSFAKYPVWFNSESDHLTWDEYRELKKLAKEIYYMADLDHTGVKQAISVGLKYMDIKLIWLPEKLRLYRDKRGYPRKDFKDYVEVFFRHEEKTLAFQNGLNKIIENSLPLQFWTETWDKESYRYNISNTRLYHFLKLMGFGRHESPNYKDGYIYVRKDGNIVKVLEPYQIANFIHGFLEDRGHSPELRDYVYNSPRLTERSFSNLPAMEIDFTNAARQVQYMFFSRKILRITPNEIVELKHGEIDNYIWEDKVIDFNLKKSDPHFEITTDRDGNLDINVLKPDNMYFNFLINASRVHWKEELEDQFDGRPEKESDEYFKKNKFNIAGPGLEADKQQEQKLHLINKIYSIGYMLHTYKNYNKAWAVYAMDNKISDLGESHGGSGKSLAYSFLNKVIKRRHYLKGRDPKLTQNEFIYSGVTENTDYIMVDDATQYLDFNFFFSEITGSMNVNQKNKDPYEIPFEKSPKLLFTSNFGMRNMDPSTFRRLLITVFSDYYHSSNENDEYKQARKVSDDFNGRNLFTDFSESDWNDFYNFCAQCIRFYLSYDFKINPPMDNVTKRSLQAEMGEAFMGWADGFFQTREQYNQEAFKYLDSFFSKEHAFEEFIKASKVKWTTNKFKKAMIAYCQWNAWEFNPKEFHKDGNRIIQKLDGKTQEVFFISTAKQVAIDNVQKVLRDDEENTVFDRD
jgi:hypothetical protein